MGCRITKGVIEQCTVRLHLTELRPHTRDYFDFSNYPESHMLKNSCNKKVPCKFKDESASKCITEFVGLRSKMYSFMLDDKKDVSKAEVRVAKGVQKSVIFNDPRFFHLFKLPLE